MHPHVELEALHYFDRPALEGLQIHSAYLRDLVNGHERHLAPRFIQNVCILSGRMDFRLTEEDDDWITVAVADEQDVDALFHRVNNAVVHRLALNFRRESLPFLRYLQSNAAVLQCQIAALEIEATDEQIDYALVDFLGAQLRPHIYKMTTAFFYGTLMDDYAVLFARNALRGNIAHLEYDLNELDAPEGIIPELFGVDVETCEITTGRDPRPWIGNFIAAFATVDRGTAIVGSVTLLHTYYGEYHKYTRRMSDDVSPLGQPRRAGVPTPHSDFVKEWMLNTSDDPNEGIFTESAVADLFEFENAQAGKKLEVFAWTIEQTEAFAPIPGPSTFPHYAFLLKVVDM